MAECPLDRSDQLKLLLDNASYPKVFLKISDMWSLSKQSYLKLDAQDQVKRLYFRFGAQRLMWATNWPVSLQQHPRKDRRTLPRPSRSLHCGRSRGDPSKNSAAHLAVWHLIRVHELTRYSAPPGRLTSTWESFSTKVAMAEWSSSPLPSPIRDNNICCTCAVSGRYTLFASAVSSAFRKSF
jgi:hypothetical protein